MTWQILGLTNTLFTWKQQIGIMKKLYGNCFLTENYICLFLDKLVDLINQIKEAGMKVLVKIAIIMLGQQPFST